jgi:phosphodiesterase/alkaline phosphatase D-like protein
MVSQVDRRAVMLGGAVAAGAVASAAQAKPAKTTAKPGFLWGIGRSGLPDRGR